MELGPTGEYGHTSSYPVRVETTQVLHPTVTWSNVPYFTHGGVVVVGTGRNLPGGPVTQ